MTHELSFFTDWRANFTWGPLVHVHHVIHVPYHNKDPCSSSQGVAHCAAPLPPNDAHLSVDLRLEAAARQGVGTESVAAQKKPKSCFHKWGSPQDTNKFNFDRNYST